MKLMSLSLTLATVDLAETEKFYREVLLLSPQFIDNSHAEKSYLILFVGKMKVVFQRLAEIEAQHPALLQNLTRVPLGVGVQLEMSCAKLDDIYRMVNFYRWPISYELDDRQHQRRELWLHDPNGYLLVLNEEK
jgi:catechol 2,3-dioxygenase-like lactoylglutathione lyase family enzyme